MSDGIIHLLFSAASLLLLYRVDQKMSAEHSVYSAHEAQEMLSNMREMSKSVRHAESEKQQLLQVGQCRWKLAFGRDHRFSQENSVNSAWHFVKFQCSLQQITVNSAVNSQLKGNLLCCWK